MLCLFVFAPRDEWVHCLRLAPAHSKVVGDTGPDETAEKTLVTILGAEWYQFLHQHPRLLADVHIRMSGIAPWHRFGPNGLEKECQPPSTSILDSPLSNTTPTRQMSVSASPTMLASLDPDEDELNGANDGFSLHATLASTSTFSSSSSSSSIAMSPSSAASSTPRVLPPLTLYGHDCFLRARCPRVFKYLRSHVTGANDIVHYSTIPTTEHSTPKIAPSSTPHTPMRSQHHAKTHISGTSLPSAINGGTKSLQSSPEKLVRSSTASRKSTPPLSSSSSSTTSHTAASASSSSSTIYSPPPSARLAKSASSSRVGSSPSASASASSSTLPSRSGSSTARPSMTRQSSLKSIPTHKSSMTPTKSSVGSSTGLPVSPPTLVHATSSPSARPNSSSNLLRAKATSSTPNGSLPTTPRLQPSSNSPQASPTARRSFGHVKSKLDTGRSPTSVQVTRKTRSSTGSIVEPSTPPRSARQRRASVATTDGPDEESQAVASIAGASAPVVSTSLLTPSPPVASTMPSEGLFPTATTAPPSDVSPPSSSLDDAVNSSSSVSAINSLDLKSGEEEKEESPQSTTCSSTSSSPPTAPSPPKYKTLVLPLSSSKALHAFLEYAYTDSITHTAVGERRAESASNHRSKSKSSDGSSTSSPMSVLDLLELACLASSLHDTRLLCLTSLHLQRTLTTSNVLTVLQILDQLGALQMQERRATLAVNLNGCLTVPENTSVPNSTKKETSSTPSSASPNSTDPFAVPSAWLLPDTRSNFLQSGLDLLGGSSHRACDLDLITRQVLDFIALQWNGIFSQSTTTGTSGSSRARAANEIGASNMKLLHSLPFATFQLVVNLRNSGGPSSQWGVHGNSGYVFKSVEEKAIYSQAHINAALIAAGIQPSAHHNLFTHALTTSPSPSHDELLMLIAAPTIALPPCQLVKVMKKLYDAPRNERTCDVRLVIEDDTNPTERVVKHTLWAHRIILAWGSEFFRTYFRTHHHDSHSSHNPTSATSPLKHGWDHSSTEVAGESKVSTIYFPSSSFTPASLEAVLRYIYTNDTKGIDFVTALYCMNTHVTNYFGLRQYGNGATQTSTSQNSPSTFVSDLERSCIQILHQSLAIAPVSPSSGSSSSIAPSSSPSIDCLALIQTAYSCGDLDRSLFEKIVQFLDWSHLNEFMRMARRKKLQEETAAAAAAVNQAKSPQQLHRLDSRRDSEANESLTHSEYDQESEGDSNLSPFSPSSSSSSFHGHRDRDRDRGRVVSIISNDLTPSLSSSAQFDFIAAMIEEKARQATNASANTPASASSRARNSVTPNHVQ